MFAKFQIRFEILGRRRPVSRAHGLSTLALALASVAGLAACGQKGPLFMPPPPRLAPSGVSPAMAPALPASAPAGASGTNDLPAPPPASGPVILPQR